MLFINFARCHSFDSADLVGNATTANNKTQISDLIRECEVEKKQQPNHFTNVSAVRLIAYRVSSHRIVCLNIQNKTHRR